MDYPDTMDSRARCGGVKFSHWNNLSYQLLAVATYMFMVDRVRARWRRDSWRAPALCLGRLYRLERPSRQV